MLNLTKAAWAIQDKKAELMLQMKDSGEARTLFMGVLTDDFATLSVESFNQKIENHPEPYFIGAKATEDLERGLIRLFPENFCDQSQVLVWRDRVLANRICLAVDGSQVNPDKNLSLFCGAIQVAWFINYHSKDKPCEKDLEFQVCLPTEPGDEDLPSEAASEIACQRFELETGKLASLISDLPKRSSDSKPPIAFFDGSLTLSFTKSFKQDSKMRERYRTAMHHLLHASKQYQIPVVGYIDTSRSYNLVNSLKAAFPDKLADRKLRAHNTYDASLLRDLLNRWGSQSAYFEYYDKQEEVHAALATRMGFCYLKTSSSSHHPARIEVPLWVYQEGLLPEVIEVVMAECLVGNGYPYAVEVADSVAVLTSQERDKFIDLLNKMIGGGLSLSPKLKSKKNRRPSSKFV